MVVNMSIVLFIIYILIFIFQIFFLVQCMKNKNKWKKLFLFETIALILALILLWYYNQLPGYGFMPGLTYLGEVLVSFGAIVIFLVMLFASIVLRLITYARNKNK